MGEGQFLAVDAGRVFLGDNVPMRVDFGIAENGGNAIFKTLGDEVFEPLRLLVHFVPGILQNVVQKEFKQTMMADEFPGAAFSGRCEPNTPMFLIRHQGRTLRCEPLQHSGH